MHNLYEVLDAHELARAQQRGISKGQPAGIQRSYDDEDEDDGKGREDKEVGG